MWPSTLYPEKTYRFLKNVYDNYGRKKSVSLDSQTQQSPSSGSSTPHLSSLRPKSPGHNHLVRLLPASPSPTFSPSVSCETSSTPSSESSNLTGHVGSEYLRKPSMTRLLHYSKSVAQDVRHKLSMSRLSKIDSTESDTSSKEVPIESGTLSPQADSYRRMHEMHQIYATGSRIHHSEPFAHPTTEQLTMCQVGNEFMLAPLSTSPRISPSMSPGKAGHFFVASDPLSCSHTQRRLSYRSYANHQPIANADVVEGREEGKAGDESQSMDRNARTVLLDKFASESDVPNRGTGGITLCGGLEVGLSSIYISRVAPNSAAHKCGLSPGDQILSANYVSFLEGITCKRAYEILASNGSQSVLLTVLPRREAFAPRQRRHHCYAWIDSEGRNVSPPPPDRNNIAPSDSSIVEQDLHYFSPFRRAPRLGELHRTSASTHQSINLNEFSPLKRNSSFSSNIRHVTITLEKGIDLGLMIRGGIEYGLGIYVTRVDANSLADKANLRVGDQILSVNEFDFTEAMHDEAVDILKSSARLNMRVVYVGKVPATTFSPLDSSPSNWSPRHSPHNRFYASSSSSSGVGGGSDLHNFALATSPTSSMKAPGSPGRHSPHHRLTPLSHSNSSPTSASARHHHTLQQSHSYRGECRSPRLALTKDSLISPFEKRDTPTLLITDSDNRALPPSNSELIRGMNDEDDNELFVLTVDRALGKGYLRKRLKNTRSEEDEQILDEECLKYLNEKDRLTLAYYRNEYETNAMSVDTLVVLLSELLDTEEKYSLIYRLYHVIRPKDVDRFEELVFHHEERAAVKRKAIADEKYKRFFKQESNESGTSFECTSNETGSAFEGLAMAPAPGLCLRTRNDSVVVTTPEYSADIGHLSMLPLDNSHHYHLELHDNSIETANQLSRSECLMTRRPSNTAPLQKQPSPNSAAYRKTFMTRRHSSGTSDTPIIRDTSPHLGPSVLKSVSAFGSYPLVADERRWSVANTECRRPSALFTPNDLRRSQSPARVSFNPNAEDIEATSQARILSRKGSNSSCCQETIPETDDTQLTPSSPTAPTLTSASGALRGSGNHLHVPTLNDGSSDTEDGGSPLPNHLRVRRHRSLPSPTFSTEKLLSANFVPQQRSASFRLPSHRTVTEPNGRWRIKVKKLKSFLGIAIEGGENVTTQTQPRIISIHSSGAAVECSDLHVGHIILEVDGQSTASLNHEQVAQMISRAYYNTPHKDYVEFLVREKNRNEFDLRRSSFMLLNNSFE